MLITSPWHRARDVETLSRSGRWHTLTPDANGLCTFVTISGERLIDHPIQTKPLTGPVRRHEPSLAAPAFISEKIEDLISEHIWLGGCNRHAGLPMDERPLERRRHRSRRRAHRKSLPPRSRLAILRRQTSKERGPSSHRPDLVSSFVLANEHGRQVSVQWPPP